MTKNNFELTKDYIDVLSLAGLLTYTKNEESISADEIFISVYDFLKKFSFNKLFWTYLWISDTAVLQDFYEDNYWVDLQDDIEIKIDFEVDNILWQELDYFETHGFKKLDFLALLYVSCRHISPKFKKFLNSHKIDLNAMKSKIDNLLKNPAFYKVWTISLFNILYKLANALNLDYTKIENIISWDDIADIKFMDNLDIDLNADDDSHSSQDTAKISSNIKNDEKKLTIEYFGTDLTKEAKSWYLDPFVWREKEINQLIYTLLRKTKNNPLLIWEAGVWKTAIVEWFAQKIVAGQVSEKLKNKKIFILDMWSLLAGTKYRWEFEARFKAILEEAADPLNNIILFIDEIHTIIWAGNAEWSADAANMLKPLLSRGKIQLIGSTTFDEYQKHIEKDPALKRRFQEIVVDEPNRDDSITILAWIKDKFEDFHGINISETAIINAVDLSTRYLLNKQLPDKAIDLLDEACARKSTLNEKLKNNDDFVNNEKELKLIQEKIEKAILSQDYFAAAELKEKEEKLKNKLKNMRSQTVLPKDLRPTVDENDIGVVLAEKLGIPENEINQSEIQKLKKLDWVLKAKMLGQDDVIDNVVKSIRRNRLSIVKKTKPIASFLFLGPSWVGKTYLSKLLATEFFGDPKSLIRVDMSEFMEKHSVSKLIGSAPGYVGYDEGGALTESVRRKPYSVILFDEIEKASPEVLNILLQILDEWHLKDNKWRRIDFKNTIIILTSNIWSEEFGKKIPKIWFTTSDSITEIDEENYKTIKDRVLEKLKDFLAPELINRLDYIVVYKPLSKQILSWIFKTKIEEFLAQWKEKKWIKLPKFTDKKIAEIIDEIYDPQFGARPIERYIYDKIEPDFIDQIMKTHNC